MGCNDSRVTQDTYKETVVDAETSQHTFHSRYKLLAKIGQGGFGAVYFCRERLPNSSDVTGPEYATKIIDIRKLGIDGRPIAETNSKLLMLIENEIAIMRRVKETEFCAYIVENFWDESFAYLVMRRSDSTLLKALETCDNISERLLKTMFTHMLSSLDYIHSKHIVHRDVKPDNFLCHGPSRTLQLCDFGLAVLLRGKSHRAKGTNGTAPFMCPEMLQGSGCSTQADVWSFGVIAYLLLLGHFPYQPAEKTSAGMQAAILKDAPPPSFAPAVGRNGATLPSISDPALDFLRRVLTRDPELRPDAAELLLHPYAKEAAQHPADPSQDFRPAFQMALRAGAFDLRKIESTTGQQSMDAMLVRHQLRAQAAWLTSSGAAGAVAKSTKSPQPTHRRSDPKELPGAVSMKSVLPEH